MKLECLCNLKCDQGVVRKARFNVNGQYCLTCGSNGTIKLWNPYEGLYIETYSGHAGDVNDVCASCDSSKLISCGIDKSVILWDVPSARVLKRFRGHAGKITCVAFNEESTVAVSGSQDNKVLFWDTRNPKNESIQILDDAKDVITSLQVTDHEILVSSLDGFVRCYDIRSSQFFADFFEDPVMHSTFTKDSQCILVSCKNIIRLIDKSTGERLSEYEGHITKDYLIESCISSKDNYILSGSADGNVWCWELISSKCYQKLPHASEKVVHSITCHPTEDFFLTAAGKNIFLWGEKNAEPEGSKNTGD